MAYCQSDILTKDEFSNSSTTTEFSLYVNNLPAELNENGFLQIFNHYGEVIGHFYRPNATWGYITYGKCRDAQNAIKDLHNVPPLRLKVSFAKERKSNEIQFKKVPTSEDERFENYNHIQEDNYMKEPHQMIGRGKPMDILKKVEENVGIPKYYTPDNELLYIYPNDPFTYNPYEEEIPFRNSNTLWTRGKLSVSQDGKRHVSRGRGYTMFEIPDPHPEVQFQIAKVYEKRTGGLYKYGNDMFEKLIGKCQNCSKETKFMCEKCRSFYCSRNCQVVDWPKHSIECQTIPDLVSAMGTMKESQFHSNSREQTPNRSIFPIQKPLRRPKDKILTNMASPNTNTSDEIAKNQNATKVLANNYNGDTNEDQTNIVKNTDQYNTSPKNNTNKSISIPIRNKSSVLNKSESNEEHNVPSNKTEEYNHSSVKKIQYFNVKDVTKIETEIAFSKHTFLPLSKFVDVKIIGEENDEYWVQKLEDHDKIRQLMDNLKNEVQKAKKVQPIVGNIYAVQYQNVWHRAFVKSMNPTVLHYIDIGIFDLTFTNDIREIHKFKNIPRYSAKIRLSNQVYKKLKYNDIISVKCISVDDNEVITVEVQGENVESIAQSEVNNTSISKDRTSEPEVRKLITEVSTSVVKDFKPADTLVSSKVCHNRNIQTTLIKLNSVVNTLSHGEKGILEIHAELKNNVYGITLLPNNAQSDFEKLLYELPPICEQKAKNFDHRPKVGELICGQRLDGDWLRGYLLSLDIPLKMAIIEETRMMEINRTVPCPDDFANICAFGATCEIINTTHKFTENEQCDFKVAHKQHNEIEIEIFTNQETVKAVVRPWAPEPEQKGLLYAKLKNKSEVCLTAYRNHIYMYARSLDVEEQEYYNNVLQSVAKCAQTAPSLKEPPVVGQMVISRYIDDNYYRAVVIKVEGTKITVAYVDYGNLEVTTVQKLKALSDQLKQLRSCTSKIVLKDVPQNTPMTQEISDYLSDLVGRDVPLMCTFDGVPSVDGVCLKLHNGECINKTISEMLVPTWNKISKEEDTTCYMINDLKVVSMGKVGDQMEVHVLYCIDEGIKYSVCPLDYELMVHIFDIMPKMMTEYCEKSTHYIPRENELCLALYDKGWYRAICLRRTETPTTSTIFFVDFGNIESVAHTDIRLMPKDFITPDALANICKIVNIIPSNKEEQYSISERIVVGNTIKIKIIECDGDGIYNVEVLL